MRRVALGLAVGLGLASGAWSAPGDLDATFGTGGAVITTLSPNWDQIDVVRVQPDGMIVVGGSAFDLTKAVIARYDATGAPDPGFGTGGLVTFTDPDMVVDLLLEPDGKIVVAGRTSPMVLVRLNPDGSIDTDFGVAGFAETGITGGHARIGGLARQFDGKLVVAGSNFETNFAVERFLPDGTVDSAFGAFGIAEAAVGTDDEAQSFDVAIQPDGRIVVGGEASSNGFTDMALVRFDTAGQLDPGFGTGGVKLQPVFGATTDDGIVALVLQPDGKIVALGGLHGGSSAFVLARFGTTGTLDGGFGVGGMQIFGVSSSDFPEALAMSPSGRFLIAGESQGILTIARVTANGFVDGTFGGTGVVRYDDPPLASCCSQLHAIALQSDGRIVAGGYMTNDFPVNGFDTVLMRVDGGECGNGIVEAGEGCDETSPCCAPTCQFQPLDAPCGDDGLACTRDVCDGAGSCTHPGNVLAGCTSPLAGGGRLTIREDADDARDTLVWRARKSPAVAVAALGNPLLGTSYALCGFGANDALLFQLDAPAGGTCAGQACWKSRGEVGFGYRDREATPSGTTVLTTVAGPVGRPRFTVKGKGTPLPMPALPLASSVRVQLQASNGFCVDTSFSSPTRNDARHFRAKSD